MALANRYLLTVHGSLVWFDEAMNMLRPAEPGRLGLKGVG